MFRAINEYDGSSTSKCICLSVGDKLSEVHALDDTWYIGHNENTGETGAFPIACVEPEVDDVPLNHPPSAPRERIFSAGAKQFDEQRFTLTRPEKTFTLKTVDPLETETAAGRPGSTVVSETDVDHIFSLDDDIAATESEFDYSWQESTFEKSYITSMSIEATPYLKEDKEDGKYHRLKSDVEVPRKGLSTISIVSVGIISLVLYIIFVYLLLVTCFAYSHIEAAVATALVTLVFLTLFLVFHAGRFAATLLFPNLLTGTGNSIIVTAIFGLLLTHSLVNIANNMRTIGDSMVCLFTLMAHQKVAGIWRLPTPFVDTKNFINRQKDDLLQLNMYQRVFGKLSDNLQAMTDQFDVLNKALEDLKKICRQAITDVVKDCNKECPQTPIVDFQCLKRCSKIFDNIRRCELFSAMVRYDQGYSAFRNNTLQFWSFINKTDQQLFDVDVEADVITLETFGNESSNGTGESLHDLTGCIQSTSDITDIVIGACAKALSISLIIFCFQTFLYARKYLSDDDFDNSYVTREYNSRSTLGIKMFLFKGKDELVDTTSMRFSSKEKKLFSNRLFELMLYFILIGLVEFLDCGSYYILNVIREVLRMNTKVKQNFDIHIKGDGPIIEYFSVLLQGGYINDVFMSSIHETKCLAKPSAPTHVVYCVSVTLFVLLVIMTIGQGHGKRLRRRLASFIYPAQEADRMNFFHMKIQRTTASFYTFIRQYIQTSYKERMILPHVSIIPKLQETFTFLGKCCSTEKPLECLVCEMVSYTSPGEGCQIRLTKCMGEIHGVSCAAVYCQQCWRDIDNSCPICT